MIVRAITLLLTLLVAGTVATACSPVESHAATRSTGTYTVPTKVASQSVREPLMARMVNCEDYDVQPCYTYDEGSYRMVLSYAPYKAVKLSMCKEEDGGPVLPCIWKDNNRVKKGQPITRNVFTKG